MARGDTLESVVPQIRNDGDITELTATDTAAASEPVAQTNRSALGKVIDQEWAP
jgi:hypothetical protein